MKLIHLSDLHLGKRVNEFSMVEDQKYILWEILGIIDEEKPDGILLAGDLYDRPILRKRYSFLTAFSQVWLKKRFRSMPSVETMTARKESLLGQIL